MRVQQRVDAQSAGASGERARIGGDPRSDDGRGVARGGVVGVGDDALAVAAALLHEAQPSAAAGATAQADAYPPVARDAQTSATRPPHAARRQCVARPRVRRCACVDGEQAVRVAVRAHDVDGAPVKRDISDRARGRDAGECVRDALQVGDSRVSSLLAADKRLSVEKRDGRVGGAAVGGASGLLWRERREVFQSVRMVRASRL